MFQKKFEIYKDINNIKIICLVSFEKDKYKNIDLLENVSKIIKIIINRVDIKKSGFILLNIISKQRMKEINNIVYPFKEYSDVLSIPLYDEEEETTLNNPIGEIYICYEKTEEQAKKYFHSIKREILFLFIHGFLHLLNFDHIEKLDENIMFKIQEFVLDDLKIKR